MSLLADVAKMNQRIPLIPPVLETDAKSYYMVPNRRVRAFVGREDILERIETGFSAGSAPRIVVLRGLGGQGKTQVALEYCRRAKSTQVRGIFWVEAMSESTLRKSFESIAEKVKGPDDILQDADARVAFVLEKLGAWPYAWLMVFDNYDDPVSFNNVQDFMPMGEQGSILVTSRHAQADSLADEGNAIELLGLDERDALELLFRQSMIKETDTRSNEGKLIVKRLGYHPLAIAQAGSYIKQQKIELHQFIDHYNQRREIILQQTPHMSQYRRTLNGAERETTLNVFTTWELSFQQLQAGETVSNRKADLLTLFAFFDCRDISENMFEVYCNSGLPHRDSESPGGSLSSFLTSESRWNSDLFVEVLIDLAQMSLVQAWSREDADGFCHLSLHPLIKDWIRLRTDKTASQKYALVAAEILGELIRSCWRYGDFEIPFLAKQAVLSHLDVFEENTKLLETNSAAPPSDLSDTPLYDLESWFAHFLSCSGRYKEAGELRRRALEGNEKARGPEHLETLMSINNLATTLYYQGKYEVAEKMFRQTLESQEKVLGSEHSDTLGSRSNLALALQYRGKYEAAEEMFRQTLESQEKILGREHPDTLRSMGNIALALYSQGKYEAAEEMHRQTLESQEKVLGSEHRDTLRSISYLGLALHSQGKYEAAEEMHRQTLESQEKALGREHPDTLGSMGYLALALRYQGKYEAAEEMFRQMLESQEKVLGREHPDTLQTMGNLALALYSLGKYEAAEKMFRHTHESEEKVLGREHLNTLKSMGNLALVLRCQRKYEAAEEMYRQTLESQEKVLGREHPETLASLEDLTNVLKIQGKDDDASILYQ